MSIWFETVYKCSAKATDEYERARKKVASFTNVGDAKEIFFTRNATEAINLVAYSWGLANLKLEDELRSLLGHCIDLSSLAQVIFFYICTI